MTQFYNPKTIHEAFDIFYKLEGDNFKSSVDGRSLYIYDSDEGLWRLTRGNQFISLYMKHSAVLGKWGQTVRSMTEVTTICRSHNKYDSAWLSRLDKYATGEIAFKDCIYNLLTRERRALSRDAMITCKLDYNAPHRDATMKLEDVQRILSRVHLEGNLRNEVLKQYSETNRIFLIDAGEEELHNEVLKRYAETMLAPSPESLFERFMDITGVRTDTVSADYLYPKFQSKNCPQTKPKFRLWMRTHAKTTGHRGIRFVNASNKAFFRGVKFKDARACMGNAQFKN
jgi:hypothetical protein